MQKFYIANVHNNISAVFVTHDVEEALLIGNYVRIGVTQDSEVIKINKGNIPPHDWEMQDEFYKYRKKILTSLEKLQYG